MRARGCRASRKGEPITLTAYHEAGHAVAAVLLRCPVESITIEPGEDSGCLGRCVLGDRPSWLCPDTSGGSRARFYIERRMMILLAGRVAESKHLGRPYHEGSEGDEDKIARLAEVICGSDGEDQKFIAWLHARTVNLLSVEEHWQAVERVVAELLERKTLKGAAVRRVVEQALHGCGRRPKGPHPGLTRCPSTSCDSGGTGRARIRPASR